MKSFTEDEQAIIANGDLAEAAIKTPAFADAINTLSEQLANAIIATEPDNIKDREKCYFIHVALKELVGILNQRVALRDQLLQSTEENE